MSGIKKNHFTIKTVVVVCLIIFLCGLFSLPRLQYVVGNIFFGGLESLYSLDTAQFFFKRAAYPLFGKSHPYAHYQLSRTYFIKGELHRSLQEAQKELTVYPEHVHTHYILGLTLAYMGREDGAIRAFSRFLDYKPESWAARNDKAWLHFRIGDIDGALATIIPAVQLHPNNPWVLNTLGVLLMNKNELVFAEDTLSRALQVANGLTEAEWGKAYPGNDPRIYGTGVAAMKFTLAQNLSMVREKMVRVDNE